MAINYCDYINGDDTTGDGTFGNPYQKITQASTGLTGGDEVRVAKSPDDIDLSETLAFVDGSTSITTSVDLTSELSALDFIYKTGESDNIHEIITITSTTLTLYKPYRGTTETVAGKKLGVTCTQAPGSYDPDQQVMESGTSSLLRLKISGGWDLSTQVQNGHTYFRQIYGATNNKYGYGLYINSQNYLEIEKLGFLRYIEGIYCYNSNYNNISEPICNNNGTGINIFESNYNNINTIKSNNNGYNGIEIYNSQNNIINTVNCNNNNICGINIIDSNDNNLDIIECADNIWHGIDINNSNNNDINNATCNDNNREGIYINSNSNFNNIITPICNNNIYRGIYINSNSNFNNIDTPICNDDKTNHTDSHGIEINNSQNNIIKTPNCNQNRHGIEIREGSRNTIESPSCIDNLYGIYLDNSFENIITSPICNDNSEYGIYCNVGTGNTVNNYSGTGNILGNVYSFSNIYHPEVPLLKIQHHNTVGDNRCYFADGITYRNTTEARSTQCLRYEPTSDTYYIKQIFRFTAPLGAEKNISFYIKDDVAFDGDTQAALYFMEEKISGWLTIPTTNDYVRHTLIAQAVDITEDGVLQLRIKVRGTAGNVYVDDLGVL